MKTLGISFLAVGVILIAFCAPVFAEPFPDYYVPVFSFGSQGTDPGEFRAPSGIAVSFGSQAYDRYVYVADTNNDRIQQFEFNGTFVREVGGYGSGEGEFIDPADVAYRNGFFYVADMGNDRVQKFTWYGTFVREFGGHGHTDGLFDDPTDIAIDADGYVYVADKNNNRIQKFNSNGVFQRKWSGVTFPTGISVQGSRAYVVDSTNRTKKFSLIGTLLAQWDVMNPSGVFVSGGQLVFVPNYLGGMVAIYNTTGVYKGRLGRPGSGRGQLDHPSDAGLDVDGYLYVLDKGNNRVSVYERSNPIPEITSLSPENRQCDSAGFTLTVNGVDFRPTSFIIFNNTRLTTTYVSTQRLTATVPGSLITAPGRLNVTVRNPTPGGGMSGNAVFRVTSPVPLIYTLVPSSRAHGGAAFDLTVTGSNFIPESVVRWNGAARTTTYISGTELSARITVANLATAGTATVNVRNPNPGGGISNDLPFTIT
ncbi:MAG: hypothetical protein LUQ25_05060 [Methanoregulaceae archaeon]|nr:hypothetical protein [Methanoregulaceae archaeon]